MSDLPRPSSRSPSSHRESVRSTSMIGAASFINIGVGLIRLKTAAVILGPVGVGLIGVLQNLLNAATTLGGMGIATAGAREIVSAQATAGPGEADFARRAVRLTAAALTIVSAVSFWALSGFLARVIFKDESQTGTIALLTIAVAATVASGYQVALITADRRISDLARMTVLSAVVGAIFGSLAVAIYGSSGIIPFILATPIATLFFGIFYTRRVPTRLTEINNRSVKRYLVSISRLGAGLTLAIFVSLCGQLFIRTRIESSLGATQLGHFQAAWLLTTVYLQFIFQTMGSDYLPRLTASIHDPQTASRLIAEQTEIGLLLGAPVVMLAIGGAPWILSLLYTSEFTAAQTLLRWQVVGDLFRLVSWPVSFLLLARNSTVKYALLDIMGTILLVFLTVLLLPQLGIVAPGFAYAAMNACYLITVLLLVHLTVLKLKFGQPHLVFALLAISCAGVFIVCVANTKVGLTISVVGSAAWSLFAIRKLERLGALPSLRRHLSIGKVNT